jgi:phospholipase/carboxylesterase
MEDETRLKLAHLVRPATERPPNAESGASTPGLLLIHGRGADEYDLMGLAEALDPRFTIVSVRAPFNWGSGYAWYGIPELPGSEGDHMRASLEQLRPFIEAMMPAYAIDPRRLWVVGFSQGAAMSAALALTSPETLRGIVMHSGYVPMDRALNLQPERARDVGIFMAHGKYDDVIPPAWARASEAYLRPHIERLTYREYPIGHSISEESLYDFSEWLSAEL